MNSILNNFKDEPYLFDKIGRVIVEKDRVLRIISDLNSIDLYKKILNSPKIESLFLEGLVATKIFSEDKNENLLILEHQKLNYILHPSEYTNEMFWDSAVMYIKLCKSLYKNFGVLTVDAHPWNITFDGSKPVFFDFSSIFSGKKITQAWLNEFEKYFALPIKLASFSQRTYGLSQEYRREHLQGFGLNLLKKNWLKNIFNKSFLKITKHNKAPDEIFDDILIWLYKNKPRAAKPEYWLEYEQSHEANSASPITQKQKFVYNILENHNPSNVLDLAANKGYYSMMAANLGASVLALDYEERTVDSCRKGVSEFGSKVTPGMLNFIYPTPPSGAGLMSKSAYERFSSDIVLALGLIHHVCLTQQFPVYLFCEICKNYAINGVLLEFVDPTDIHIRDWNVKIPIDYNLDHIKKYMSDKFPKIEMSQNLETDGINRALIYFYR